MSMQPSVSTDRQPAYDADFYADEFIADPYPHYQALRELGPAVWLTRNDGWAITRFAEVRDALRNHQVFISGRGVMMNQPTNDAAAGTSVLNMDGQQHRATRQVMGPPLAPAAIAPLQTDIQQIAVELVAQVVARGKFDGVSEFAHVLPLMLVSRLVGLPEDGREQMLDWAGGIFNVIGNINERFFIGVSARDKAMQYLAAVRPERLLPGSWGARLFEQVAAGTITDAQARLMLFDYVAPALDTTINATSSALWLLGLNPDQWAIVRADPSKIPGAVDEALRLESPIRAFSRYVARDHDIGGITLREGERALLVYASANRDERHWQHADRYDVCRTTANQQLSFGTGLHTCVGMHLARLEMCCLFEALAQRVVRFEVGAVKRELHNVLRGIQSLEITITAVA